MMNRYMLKIQGVIILIPAVLKDSVRFCTKTEIEPMPNALKKYIEKVPANKINRAAMDMYKKFLLASGALFLWVSLSTITYSNSNNAACQKLCSKAMQKL